MLFFYIALCTNNAFVRLNNLHAVTWRTWRMSVCNSFIPSFAVWYEEVMRIFQVELPPEIE